MGTRKGGSEGHHGNSKIDSINKLRLRQIYINLEKSENI